MSKLLEVTFEKHPSLRAGTSEERTAEDNNKFYVLNTRKHNKKIIFIEQKQHNWRSFEL